MSNRIVRGISLASAACIFVGWAGLMSLYIHGRLFWGHWPRVSLNDPKDVGSGLHYALVQPTVMAMMACTFLVFVFLAVLAAIEHRGARWPKQLAFLAAIGSLALMMFTRLFMWFLD